MALLITIGTVSYRAGTVPADTEVIYTGEYVTGPDGTPYMVWDNALNNVRPMTQSEIDALPAQMATATAKAEKAAAVTGVDDAYAQKGNRVERIVMAAAEVALDATNAERKCMSDMNTAVQAATSLADLKTRFAAISFPLQVTRQQLMSAVKAKINATPE